MTGSSGLFAVAGTSASSPAFAGIAALLAQRAGGRLGNLNPLIYAAGRTQYGVTGAVTPPTVVRAGGSVGVNLVLYQTGTADADAVATVTVAVLPAGVTAEFRPGNPADKTAGVLSRTESGTLTLSDSGGRSEKR